MRLYCISIRIFRQNTDFIYEYFVEYKLHHATWRGIDVSQILMDSASPVDRFCHFRPEKHTLVLKRVARNILMCNQGRVAGTLNAVINFRVTQIAENFLTS